LNSHYGVVEKEASWIVAIRSDPAYDRGQVDDEIRFTVCECPIDPFFGPQVVLA
jgi:hypothetical protein